MSPAQAPPSIVIIVDGLRIEDALEVRATLRAAMETIRAASPSGRVALMRAEGAEAPKFLAIDEDFTELDRAGSGFVASGTAAPLMESLHVAANALVREASPRRAILLLTSTEGSPGATVTPQQVVRSLRASQASLWVVHRPAPGVASAIADNDRVLGQLADLSGGYREIVPLPPMRVPTLSLLKLLLAQYEVTFDAPTDDEWRLGVRRPGLDVLALQGAGRSR